MESGLRETRPIPFVTWDGNIRCSWTGELLLTTSQPAYTKSASPRCDREGRPTPSHLSLGIPTPGPSNFP